MIDMPCPECEILTHPTKEEVIGEEYLFCWKCSISFKNPNYNKENKKSNE